MSMQGEAPHVPGGHGPAVHQLGGRGGVQILQDRTRERTVVDSIDNAFNFRMSHRKFLHYFTVAFNISSTLLFCILAESIWNTRNCISLHDLSRVAEYHST